MPTFAASLGSISGTNIAFLSHLFACDSSNHHQALHFSHQSSAISTKRAALLSPKVSVSSGSAAAKTDEVDQVQAVQKKPSLPPEADGVDQVQAARQARRSADWKAAQAYKEKGTPFEGRVEGFNGGGLLIRFYSILGFLPFPQLGPSYSCKGSGKSIQEIAKDLTGSTLPLKVIHADETNRKLIFSEKEALWSKFSSKLKVGDVFQGKVGSVEDYGAFVHLRFPDGGYHLTGLVHVSEVSWDLVQDASDVLTEGDEVRVKIISIDRERSRLTLSLKQMEEDPLFETLETVIPQNGSTSDALTMDSYDIVPLPGLDTIIQELQNEEGINNVIINRQGFEKRVVSQDLQLWLSNAAPIGDQFTLLARAGRQVQEIILTTSLDQEGIKRALQRVLERVP